MIVAQAARIAVLHGALTELLATYRATHRPPDTVMKAEQQLDRIRAASAQANAALSTPDDASALVAYRDGVIEECAAEFDLHPNADMCRQEIAAALRSMKSPKEAS